MAVGEVTVNLTNALPKRCASFDGVDDYVDIPHEDKQLLTNGFSISAWINPKSSGVGNVAMVVDKSSSGTTGTDGFVYYFNSNFSSINRMAVRVNAGSTRFSSDTSISIDGTWTHIVLTIDANALVTHYANGVLSGTPGTTGALSGITTTNNLRIGIEAGGTTKPFDGLISDVQIFNKVLTQAEVTKLLTNISVTDGLIYRYKLDKNYKDSVGSNDGTNAGTVLKVIDDKVSTVVSDARVSSTDKYFMNVINGKLLTTAIDETNGLLTSLTSYYKLDEASGDAIDPAGSNDGTVNGAVQNQTGKILQAYEFDGVDDNINIDSFSIATNITLNCWAKLDDNPSSSPQYMIMKNPVNSEWGLFFNNVGNGTLTLRGGASSNDVTYDVGGSFTYGSWHMYTGVFSGTTGTLFLDGVQVATGTIDAMGNDTVVGTNDIKIGVHTSSSYPLDGLMDEIGIWNKALNGTDVSNLYKGGQGLSYSQFN